GDRARRGTAAIPAHHHAIELHAVLVDERYENYRASGFKQHALVDHLVGQRLLSRRLTDNDQVEAAADAADFVGSARDTRGYRTALRRNARAFGRLFEPCNGCARFL